MKNNLIVFIIVILMAKNVFAENVSIKAENISIDKKNETTIS